MSYRIRYIFEDDSPPSLSVLADNLRALDAAYRLAPPGDGQAKDAAAEDAALDILFESVPIGRATLEPVGDPSEHAGIQALLDELESLSEADDGLDTDAAAHRLWNATGLLTVAVTWEGDDHGESLKRLNPIWGMLLGTYPGVLYAEREGYYDAEGLLLELG